MQRERTTGSKAKALCTCSGAVFNWCGRKGSPVSDLKLRRLVGVLRLGLRWEEGDSGDKDLEEESSIID